MNIYAYSRVSSDRQNNESQVLLIENFAQNKGFVIPQENWTLETISTRKELEKRKIWALVNSLKEGDLLIIAELTRLARSVKEIMILLQKCINAKVKIISVREKIELMDDFTSTVYAMSFGLAGEIERQLISQRTKIALQMKKAQGVVLGRPKGTKNRKTVISKKDHPQIKEMLESKFSKSAIARILGVHRITVSEYLKKNYLEGKNPYFEKASLRIKRKKKIRIQENSLRKETKHLEKVIKTHKTQESTEDNKIYAYLRISTGVQDVESQKHNMQKYAEQNNLKIYEYFEETQSGAKDYKKRLLGDVFKILKRGDTLLVSEISRLSRSLYMVFEILSYCVNNGINVITITDNFRFDDQLTSKVFAFTLGLAAEVERKLISERTKAGLERVKAEGMELGRPKGCLTADIAPKLKENIEDIKDLLAQKVSISGIARIYGVHRTTVSDFVIRENLIPDTQLTDKQKQAKNKREEILTKIKTQKEKLSLPQIKTFLSDGEAPRKIAEYIGVEVSTITHFMKENKLVRENL